MNYAFLFTLIYSLNKSSSIFGCSKLHRIQYGDTSDKIEEEHALSSGKLAELNPGVNLSLLETGKSLCISRRKPATTASPTNDDECRMFPSFTVGGEEATAHHWPWQVLIQILSSSKHDKETFCGGALLNKRAIITAAHCLWSVRGTSPRKETQLRIGLGVHRRSQFSKYRNVSKIVIHKDYKNTAKANDIAIIFLKKPAEYGDKIRPILLPPSGLVICSGTETAVTGWGSTTEINGSIPSFTTGPETVYPDSLRQAKVHIFDKGVCRDLNGKQVVDGMLCAGLAHGRTDSCDGDSGGPLVLHDPTVSAFVLVGIVSWGKGCGQASQPGVYVDVAHYVPWINQTLDAN